MRTQVIPIALVARSPAYVCVLDGTLACYVQIIWKSCVKLLASEVHALDCSA